MSRSVLRKRRASLFKRAYMALTEAVDRAVRFHNLPVLPGLLTMTGLRYKLREKNLYFPSNVPSTAPSVPRPADSRYLSARTVDGTYNDLRYPGMGSAGTRFGRNVPLADTYPDPEPQLLTPNPRTVSLELLTREKFVPAPTLNILAAAWIQFMVRDWFTHGTNEKENPWQLPLAEHDPWPDRPMRILRTARDATRPPDFTGAPPTFINTESHWWDASQIYGSSKDLQARIRTGQDGKLLLSPAGVAPFDQDALNTPGTWLGLILLYTVFMREHNAICDRLRAEYPAWSDDDLFDRARLINAALMAKIHTLEWTPAIIGNPVVQASLHVNWWGAETERVNRLVGRITKNEIIGGIPGSETDHFGVPYSMTEEFVAVYRMHPLIPDDYTFRSAADDHVLREAILPDLAGPQAMTLLGQIGMVDLLYSFGVANPGAIALHNYPRHLQHFVRPDGILMDLAAVDILRTRERGVPRYNAFRKLVHLPPVKTFEELVAQPEWAAELRRVYNDDIDAVDLMVGMFAERPPKGFGFSDTAFRIFIVMASRRLNSDRFFTTDYTPRVYTQVGLDWIRDTDFASVLLRHYPQLAPALRQVQNAFAPWARVQ